MAKICPSCGRNVAKTAAICKSCSYDLFNGEIAEEIVETNEIAENFLKQDRVNRKKLLITIISAVLIAAIGIGIAAFFSTQPKKFNRGATSGYDALVQRYFNAVLDRNFDSLFSILPQESQDIIEDGFYNSAYNPNDEPTFDFKQFEIDSIDEIAGTYQTKHGNNLKYTYKTEEKELLGNDLEYKIFDLQALGFTNITKVIYLSVVQTIRGSIGSGNYNSYFDAVLTADGTWYLVPINLY